MHNNTLLQNFPQLTDDFIIQRTGIKQRCWLDNNETLLELVTSAATEAINSNGLVLYDIELIICATSSPEFISSPSLACLTLKQLNVLYGSNHHITGYDINAACSGYIFALQAAQQFLSCNPTKRVLVLTAEALSPRINKHDIDTAFLFADAATATIVCGGAVSPQKCIAQLKQLYTCCDAEDGSILSVPTNLQYGIKMQGKKLFSTAVKTMSLAMQKCCSLAEVDVSDIALVIPHQANQRILRAVEQRLKLPPNIMYSNLALYGNTSSCTIPIALNEALDESLSLVSKTGQFIALCAFGAGFTYGAAILTRIIDE